MKRRFRAKFRLADRAGSDCDSYSELASIAMDGETAADLLHKNPRHSENGAQRSKEACLITVRVDAIVYDDLPVGATESAPMFEPRSRKTEYVTQRRTVG